MPRSRFSDLAQRLLDDGVSPNFVSRLERELEAHLEDLLSSELSRHKSPEDAEQEALSRLGDAQSIAMVFRERPELRLWIYQWPWTFVVNLIAAVLLTIQWPALLVTDNRASLARIGSAAILSVGVTAIVFFVMVSLIVTADDFSLASDARNPIISFNVNRVSIDEERPVESRSRADRIQLETLSFGRVARPRDVGPLVSVEGWLDDSPILDLGQGPLLNVVYLIDGNLGVAAGDSDYVAVLKVAPTYPKSALRRGLEGYVIVEFTITGTGAVKDIEVVESSNRIFERNSIEAVSKYRYRPRVVSGKPLEVPHVRNKFSFELEA